MKKLQMDGIETLLIIQTAHVGDAVSSLAAMRWFADRVKQTTVIVRKPFVSLFADEQGINVVDESAQIASEYDLILDFDSSSRSRKIVKLVRGRLKVGRVDGLWNRMRHALLYSHQIKKDHGHIVSDYLAIVDFFSGQADTVPQLNVVENTEITHFRNSIPYKKVWALHYTAARPHRNLPNPLVDELIERLGARGDAVWLVDRQQDGTERLLNKKSDNVFFRDLNLPDLKAALAACDGMIACDSGPAHIASAVGCPAIILYGPTIAKKYQPNGRVKIIEKDFSCRPCNQNIPCAYEQRCMTAISAEEILQLADTL